MSTAEAALAWLVSLTAACESSPPIPRLTSPDFTDWLHISPTSNSLPCASQSSSPFQASFKVNTTTGLDELALNYIYDISPGLSPTPITVSSSLIKDENHILSPPIVSPVAKLWTDLELEYPSFVNSPNGINAGSDISPVLRADRSDEIPRACPSLRGEVCAFAVSEQNANSAFIATNQSTNSPHFLLSPCRLVGVVSDGARNALPSSVQKGYSDQEILALLSPVGSYSSALPTCAKSPTSISSLSPLTPISSSPELFPPYKFKLNLKRKPVTPVKPKKRQRLEDLFDSPLSSMTESSPSSESSSVVHPIFSVRAFPSDFEISPNFPLFYRRFPAISYYQPGGTEFNSPCELVGVSHPGGNYNHPRSPFDLYTPRFVKGKGIEKVGLCPICTENYERGGGNRRLWFSMKFSAFKCYHMQYAHGVSAATGRPFSPPTAFRRVERVNPGKKEKTHIQHGKCHKCSKWIAIEGVKDMESKVKELYWWKHAAACHHESTLTGEGDYFEHDDVLSKLLSLSESGASAV